MQLEYSLEEKDFLTFQLYTASKSETIRRRRLRSKWILPVIYFFFAILIFYKGIPVIASVFIIIAILWFIFYPKYESKKYVKHYQTFIREHHTGKLNRKALLEIDGSRILSKDETKTTEILTSEISSITSLPQHYFIKLKTGDTFIVPKRALSEPLLIENEFKELAEKLKIVFASEMNWKWT